MKKILVVAVAAATASVLTGCAGMAFGPAGAPNAGLYASGSINRSAGGGAIAKKGEACASSILGIITTGDASTGAAAKKGGISKVAVIDADYSNILGLYASYCTVVHGE